MTAPRGAGPKRRGAGKALLFPIGHYVGAHHPAAGAPPQHHKVRVGIEVLQLPDQDHLTLWALAHGLPDQVGELRWTRARVLESATQVAGPERVLDSLLTTGLVAEVTPDTPQAVEFARTHRMRPLMTGLGNSPDDPLRFAIGLIGTPVVKLEGFGFELWQWARLRRDLWDTAEMFAKVDQAMAGGSPSAPSDAGVATVLTDVLERLHLLLAHNAAYLDLALDRPQKGDDPTW